MAPGGSITQCIRNLEDGVRREDAARELWDHFFSDLARYALGKLRAMNAPGAADDGEDAAERAFTKVCRGIESGQLRIGGRVDLRRLLLRAAARVAIDLRRSAARHGGDQGGVGSALAQVEDGEPGPELLALEQEGCRQLLDLLGDDVLRRIALWKLAGYTNGEIAGRLDCSLAKVERKLGRIRERWAEATPCRPPQTGPRSAAAANGVVEEIGGTTVVLRGLAGRGDP
jgi:DNA-directed RNA polymerase specialized sigma24 family protein